MALSVSVMGVGLSGDFSIYPYQARVSMMGFSAGVPVDLWYGWVALAFVVVGGALAIAGSLIAYGKKLILVGGALVILSISIFAIGLQMWLSTMTSLPAGAIGFTGLSGVGLFSSGTASFGTGGTTMTMNYSTYLSFGFWLALVSAIVMFVALGIRPKEAAPAPPQPSPVPQQAPPESPPPPGP